MRVSYAFCHYVGKTRYMILRKNFILTTASWLLLAVSAHASMMVKDRPADAWERIFKITIRADIQTSVAGSYVTSTNRPELSVREAALPDTTSTFPLWITAAD